MPLEEERRSSLPSRPDADHNTNALAMLPGWSETYEDARCWVAWNGRRRWPSFACNDEVWAGSVTSWELHGRRAA